MHQCAYKKGHSTETAMLSVSDCLLVKSDKTWEVGLSGYSTGPQLNRHSVLQGGLKMTQNSRCCSWVVCILCPWLLSVCIVDDIVSALSPFVYRVPQGSVLVLFILNSQPPLDVISDHRCNFYKYAHNTELLESYKVSHLMNFTLSSLAFEHVLMTFCPRWTAVSSSWTLTKQK